MSLGLVGRKYGMTRVFEEDGASIPVTVVQIDPIKVTQIKTLDKDGYRAVQVTAGEKKSSRVNKAAAGHFAAASTTAGRALWEFRLSQGEGEDLEVGAELTLDIFTEGQKIDVKGTSIGKGFAGGVKRHNFKMQDATHGNSLSHRAPGSIGQCQTPGRVFKGKKMAGHMGFEKKTVQNLTIHAIDKERSIILVKGAVPGSKGGDVIITPAVKMQNKD
jgi:large subunit ribosomal protein L3